MHLHIENSSALGEVFEITESRLNDALSRHPDLAARVSITIGLDGKDFRNSMKTADALFAWDFKKDNLAEVGFIYKAPASITCCHWIGFLSTLS